MSLRAEQPIRDAPVWQVWLALWTVYIVWGSTYLAIRVTVETLPPFLAAGVRFVVAGAAMYLFLAARHGRARVRFSAPELLAATAIGSLLLFAANGLVMVAEQQVPSALAALIVASVPLWVVLLRALSGERISGAALAGVAIGFAGVAVLLLPGSTTEDIALSGLLLLVVASAAWALGSFMSKRLSLPSDPFVSTSLQMVAGGVVLLVAGVVVGEPARFEPAEASLASVLGLVYLVLAGSLMGFTAFTWVLQHAPISKVATYAYVNPVVAILLGWALLSERITPMILLGATIIVASVAFIIRKESGPAAKEIGEPGAGAPGGPAQAGDERRGSIEGDALDGSLAPADCR